MRYASMNIKKIHKNIAIYFALIDTHYAQEGTQITFDAGYWWTTGNTDMQTLETAFIALGSDWHTLTSILQNARTSTERANSMHLLGWSPHTEQTVPILLHHLKDPVTKVSNAAARALFPIVVSGKYRIAIAYIVALLHRRSAYHKNKALGTLLHWPHTEELHTLPDTEWQYIRRLATHPSPLYAPVAQMVMKRVKGE
jgi:hypothetical protein